MGVMTTTVSGELAECLRSWRERTSPADVGLPADGHRRVAGLRREEVAQLAGVSMDYMTRLEQGRATNPSAIVLGSLARALRLSDLERDHLFQLAGQPRPGPGVIDTHIPTSVVRLMDRLADVPVLITTVAREIVAANRLATALFPEAAGGSRRERTLAWRRFMGLPSIRVMRNPEELAEAEEILVAELQSALARYHADTFLAAMISDLRERSPRFEELWTARRLRGGHTKEKRFQHPEVGELTLDCDDLVIQGSDLELVVFTAFPGSSSAQALELLSAIGLQRFDGPATENTPSSSQT
jgi:transcriptional regulator with XRE-family HTH domain